MNKAVRIRGAVAIAGSGLLVGGLAGCGGGAEKKAHDPVAAVKASYLKTVAAKSATAEMATTGSDGKTVRETGTKAWYPAAQDVVLKDRGEGKPDTRSIMMGDTVYSRLDQPLKGKTWMQMDLSKDGKPGVRLNQDPAEFLAMLLGQEKLAHVGAEKTDGVDAQRYKGSFTGADLLRADESTRVMEEKNRQYLHEAVKHITVFEVELWIGADGYPVRVDSSSTDDKGTTKTTGKFSGFGKPAPVQPPPADQVVAFDDVMKGVDADLEQADKDLEQADKDLEEADKTLRDAGFPGLRS
ncbi:hypothetical protein ACFVJ8_13530 [Streptomyces yangpuensis]|uniref:hypothetical protein n=1 Tax=Streptomyces TaxID=1883 RepID=UPI0004C5BA7F|nr:hypothetical protein [Streptomyces sp. NRRL S-378]